MRHVQINQSSKAYMHVLGRQECVCIRAFVSKEQTRNRKSVELGMTHTRRIMRAVTDADDALSPFPAAPTVLIIPDNRPPTVVEGRVGPPTAEARRTAVPAAPMREVGARRPDGRGPAAPATPTFGTWETICLFG
ncbi:hypothetical protein BJV78DRAFT_742997 [Lactifluus subvellereus]|nr:hypothetical protein BJV78DRAFT_742997 [Lactifluus subvellereus]